MFSCYAQCRANKSFHLIYNAFVVLYCLRNKTRSSYLLSYYKTELTSRESVWLFLLRCLLYKKNKKCFRFVCESLTMLICVVYCIRLKIM